MVAIKNEVLTVQVEPEGERTLYFDIQEGKLIPLNPGEFELGRITPMHLNPRHAGVYRNLEETWNRQVVFGGPETARSEFDRKWMEADE